MWRLKTWSWARILGVSMLLLLVAATTVQAYSYTLAFMGVGPGTSLQLRLPLSGTPMVTSKWNQPRNVSGTNPHQGVDLGAAMGTAVYAPCDGWIVSQSPSAYELVMECSNSGGLRIKFDHLSRVNIHPTPSSVKAGDKIAESGNEGGAYPAHLHFGAMALRPGTSTYVWARNEPYYRHLSAYDYGRRFDFISNVRWNNGNTVVVTAYAYDETGKYSLLQGDVVLYHRRDGTSTWQGPVTMVKSGDDFSYNLTNLGYQSGDVIHWMVRATRSSLPTSVYRVAFLPPKYAQPAENPNSTAYKYDYYRCTIGGTCQEVFTN